ncbi:MAG: WD40/YVTN/BNR-like repeat-containing protein [Bradymonadia bacterium]
MHFTHTHLKAFGFTTLLLTLVACGSDESSETTPDAGTSEEVTWGAGFEPGDEGTFMSVWGTSETDVWTVGGQPEAGVIYHRDADGWTKASDVPDGPLLNWVHGAGDTLWVVGNNGRALRKTGDGNFEATDTGVTDPLWGVWAAAPDDVWAVGGDALRPADEEPQPVLLHFDGTAWSQVPLPALDRTAPKALFKVWGTGPDNVIAVGGRGVLLRYNGTEWAQETTGTGEDLISLWGSGPDDIAVVGGRAGGVLSRWDGTAWQTSDLAGLPGLNGIWMSAAGQVQVVGNRGSAARIAEGFDFDRDQSGTLLVLHAVWGSPEGTLFAVGGSLDMAPPYEGVVLEGR